MNSSGRFVLFFMMFLWVNGGLGLSAQKMMLLERGGNPRTEKIYVGEEISFKFKNDDTGWYDRTIFDMYPDRNTLNLEGVEVPIDSIEKIRFPNRPLIPAILGTTLQAGGANMLLFDLSRATFFNPDAGLTPGVIPSAALNFGVGTALRKIFRHRKFTPGPRKRLRLIEINFSSPGKA